jgi:hypothetical protein
MIDETTAAIVLKIGDRFYCDHTKQRITTAWSLAGAKLFLQCRGDKIEKAEQALIAKGYHPHRKIVSLQPPIEP